MNFDRSDTPEVGWENIFDLSLTIVKSERSEISIDDERDLWCGLYFRYQKMSSICLRDRNMRDPELSDAAAFEGANKRSDKTMTAEFDPPETIVYEPLSRYRGTHPQSNRVENVAEMKGRGWNDCRDEVKRMLKKSKRMKTIGCAENLHYIDPEEFDPAGESVIVAAGTTESYYSEYLDYIESALERLEDSIAAQAIRMKLTKELDQKQIAIELGISPSRLSERMKIAYGSLKKILPEITNYESNP